MGGERRSRRLKGVLGMSMIDREERHDMTSKTCARERGMACRRVCESRGGDCRPSVTAVAMVVVMELVMLVMLERGKQRASCADVWPDALAWTFE